MRWARLRCLRDQLLRIPCPACRARCYTTEGRTIGTLPPDVAAARQADIDAALDLLADVLPQAAVADLVGISEGRMSQMLRRRRRPLTGAAA
jgi:hypothetical protein